MAENKGRGHIFYTRNGAGESFAEHNEHMREFRSSHPDQLEPKIFRCALINTMRPLLVAGTSQETGGTMRPVSAVDWIALAPIRTVTKHKFSLN